MTAAADPFANYQAGLDSPARGAFAVTPDDTNSFAAGAHGEAVTICRAVYIGTAGDVSLVTFSNQPVLFKNVPAGSLLPVAASRVNNSNTTASNMVALY